MLNKVSEGEYQAYLLKRYRQAQTEYLQCLRRGRQDVSVEYKKHP